MENKTDPSSFQFGKTLRAISFSGREADWALWRFKFLQHANANGYYELLTDEKCLQPSNGIVLLFDALLHSMPVDWQTRLALIPTVKLANMKGPTVDEVKTEVKFAPTPHPAVCWARIIEH